MSISSKVTDQLNAIKNKEEHKAFIHVDSKVSFVWMQIRIQIWIYIYCFAMAVTMLIVVITGNLLIYLNRNPKTTRVTFFSWYPPNLLVTINDVIPELWLPKDGPKLQLWWHVQFGIFRLPSIAHFKLFFADIPSTYHLLLGQQMYQVI